MPADAHARSAAPSAAFLEAFRTAAAAHADGVLPFDQFMALALYHPELGYYRRDYARVGRSAETDFYTATSSGPLFGELICAACVTLLGPQRDPRAFTFVEIGAETDAGILAGVAHPFAAARTLRLGAPLALTGPLIVFSNELFDAQPCRRVVARDGSWCELGVALAPASSASPSPTFIEVELTAPTFPVPVELSSHAPEGYHLDLPLAARALAAEIAAQPWTGLFVACDYGKSWRELTEATPLGTARAYYKHTQSNDLLARPGEQDLTCHVCWDWLADALAKNQFPAPTVESQEAFFVHHAAEAIAATMSAEAMRTSPRKLALMQLLHPAHLGQKFQVLHALRD